MPLIYNIDYIVANLLMAYYDEDIDKTVVRLINQVGEIHLPGYQMEEIADATNKSETTFIIDGDDIDEEKYAKDDEEEDDEKNDTDLLDKKSEKKDEMSSEDFVDLLLKYFSK